jgi:hypothetical protein
MGMARTRHDNRCSNLDRREMTSPPGTRATRVPSFGQGAARTAGGRFAAGGSFPPLAPRRRSFRRALLHLPGWLAVVAGLSFSARALAAGPVLVAIGDIRREGLRRGVFVLPRSTDLQIDAVGLADRKGERFLARGWILDLESRERVWAQPDAPGEYVASSGNWVTRDALTLPKGIYGVFFAAYGGQLPLDKQVRIFGLEVGKFEMTLGPYRQWNDEGDPEDWGIRVTAKDPGFVPAPVPAVLPRPFPDAIVRELGLGDGEYRQLRIDVDRETPIEIWATGEYSTHAGYFADGAWIVDRSDWSRIWELTRENTRAAGGDPKNRVFQDVVAFSPGSYLLTVATDQTHATGSWNAGPPWDPDAWGVALRLVDAQDRSAVHVQPGGGPGEAVVAIERVGNDEFHRKPFYVTRDARVLVRALGEQSSAGSRRFADHGWIERRSDLEEIWWMEGSRSYPAGGARKNRLVEQVIDLPAGDYFLCYLTDDSHAFGSWNAEAPFEPDAWGISLVELDRPQDKGAVHPGSSEDAPAVISIAPVRDREHIVKRFETSSPTRVRVIALGEGDDGEMYDFGWLERADTRELVWEMTYAETRRAGGARKNREVRTALRLGPGRYALHYISDGSHAFGDWNASPPDQPDLWGITLVEIPGE